MQEDPPASPRSVVWIGDRSTIPRCHSGAPMITVTKPSPPEGLVMRFQRGVSCRFTGIEQRANLRGVGSRERAVIDAIADRTAC